MGSSPPARAGRADFGAPLNEMTLRPAAPCPRVREIVLGGLHDLLSTHPS